MNSSILMEKQLKRYIKKQRIGYSLALLVGFLINGEISYPQQMTAESEKVSESTLKEKIADNNKKIEEINKRIYELLKEGDYYAKTLEDNNQFFFPIKFEHRHANKSHKMTHKLPAMGLNKPTITIPGLDLNKPTITIPGKPLLPANPNINVSDKIEVIKPISPTMPEKNEGDTNINTHIMGDIEEPGASDVTIGIDTKFDVPKIDKNSFEEIGLQIGDIKLNQYIDTELHQDENINITDTNFEVNKLNINYGYAPRQAKKPTGIEVTELEAPEEIKLPDIVINSRPFIQGAGGIIKTDEAATHPSQVVVENYGKYNTKGDGIEITFNDTKDSNNKVDTHIEYKNLENLEISVVEDIKKDEYKYMAGQSVTQEAINGFRKDFTDAKQNSDVGTFISTTMARDSVVDGKYTFNYGNTEYNNPKRIFLSVNQAGLLWQNDKEHYDGIGGADGNKVQDQVIETDPKKKQHILTNFKGTLNLKNDVQDNKKYGTLVGIDHQLWDHNGKGGSGVTDGYRKSYSIAKNSGTINLGEADGLDTNLVGMTIESEMDHITRQKLHNHVTINKGTINVNGKNSIGISFEDGKAVADDLYVGNVNLNENSGSSYGLRIKHSTSTEEEIIKKIPTKYNQLRIFGSVADNKNEQDLDIKDKDGNIKIEDGGTPKKIKVDGTSNGGVVIAQSLSSNATQYLKAGQGNGDSFPGTNELTEEEKKKYIGMFNKDLGADFEGFESGKVNPIANIHGLNIEVSGKNSVGFLRHKDYATNNKNDMIITNEESGAIKEIDFGQKAEGSVLIRSDMYGIDVQKNLTINSDGIGKETAKTNQENKPSSKKNIVLQATKTTWTKDNKKVNSVGHITNSGDMKGNADNLIGMMANSSSDYDQNAEKLDKDWTKDKAEIKNTKNITLTGKNVYGMAVLGDNKGIIDGGTVSTKYSGNSKTSDEKINNISVYNEGEFNIKNSTIETSGKGSVALYNSGTMNLEATEGKTNKIIADNGAIALYSKGGNITNSGKIEISSQKDGIGVYAKDSGKITLKDGTINVKDGLSGIASIGKTPNTKDIKDNKDKTNITLENSTLNYSGSGYALYTENDGTIDIKKSTINLDGNAFGMEVELGKENNQIHIDKDSQINVKSDGVTVFNIISTEKNKFSSALSNLKDNIGKALGNNKELFDKIKADQGVDLWKLAMVDGGDLTIDKNISQSNGKDNQEGDFYFKRFLGVRLNTTVNDNIKVDGTITGDEANKYYDGKVTGLEIVSSSKASGLDDTSITLKNGSSVIANRLDDGKDGVKNSATVGIFSNFAKVNLEDGSSVIVEKDNSDNKPDKKYNGVGIFATNGSEVSVADKAKIEVHGDSSVGIYGLAQRIDQDGKVVEDEYIDENKKPIAGQGKINIKNSGTIDVSNGVGTVGIYAINNKSNADNKTSTVTNQGTIITGSSSKTNSSVGIYGDKTIIDNQGLIEVKDGTLENDKKYGGVGIYAVNGSEVKNIGKIKLGNYGTAVVIDATSKLTDETPLEFANKDSVGHPDNKNTPQEKIGLAFNNVKKDGEEITRDLNTEIKATNISGLRTVASSGGTLNVKNKITIGDNDNRAIIVDNGTINNENEITINKENVSDINNKISSIGISAIEKNSLVNNNGKLNLNGDKSIGIVVSNEKDDSNNRIGKVGTINLNGSGNTGLYINNSKENLKIDEITGINFGKEATLSTGLYLKDSKAVLEKSLTKDLTNDNVLVKAMNGSTIENNGTLNINGTGNTKDNKSQKAVGIVLDKDSNYTGKGSLNVSGNAIGLYSKVGNEAGKQKEFDTLKITADSSNDKESIALALRGEKDTANKDILLKGTTTITLKNKNSKDEKQGIGILAKDVNLKINNMELKYESGSGVGIYLKNGATIGRSEKGSHLWIEGEKGKEYSTGVYVGETSGNKTNETDKKADVDLDIDILKEKSIGIYNDKNNFTYKGSMEVVSADSIGIFNNKNMEFAEGTINVHGNTAEKQASAGIYSVGGTVKNSGNIITKSGKDVGIYGKDTVVQNNGNIKVDKGIGVYLTGNKAEFSGQGKLQEITTGKNDSSETAIQLSNGAKLGQGSLNLSLGRKDIGILGDNTTIDGASLSKNESGINLDISKSQGAYGIVLDNGSSLKNMNISLGKEAIGVIGLDNSKIEKVEITNHQKENIKDSDENKPQDEIGIFLQNSKDKVANHSVKGSFIELDKGIGIVLQDSDSKEKNNILNLENSEINLKNIIGDTNNKSAIYVGKNNVLNSKDNTYYIKNDVGVFGRENAEIKLSNDEIFLEGKSTGIYSEGGKVTLDRNVIFGNYSEEKVNGGAVFVKKGTIKSGAEIYSFADNFYGLYLDGVGSVTNTGKIYLNGESNIGISHVGQILAGQEDKTSENKVVNKGDITIVGGDDRENTSIGIYGKNTDIHNTGTITAQNSSVGIFWDTRLNYDDNTQSKNGHELYSKGINLRGENATGALLKGKADKVFIDSIANIDNYDAQKDGVGKNNLGVYANELDTQNFEINNISLKDNSMGIYANNSKMIMNLGSVSIGDGLGEGYASFGVVTKDSDITLNIDDKISIGKNGTAVLNQNGNVKINDIEKLEVGAGTGALVHTNGGVVTIGGAKDKNDIELDINGHYGFILENNGKIQGNEELQDKNLTLNVKENGTGIILVKNDKNKIASDRPISNLGVDKITVTGSDKKDNTGYSKGVYYKNLGKITEDISDLTIENVGKKTAGVVLNGTYGELIAGDVALTEKAENSIGILVKGNGDNLTTIKGNVEVNDNNTDGENQTHGNIGIEVQNSNIKTEGNITVGKGYRFENSYPAGVYASNTNKDKNYSYEGTGDLTIDNFGSGIFGKNYDITHNGSIVAGVGAVGILSENEIYRESNKVEVIGSSITIGDDSEEYKDRIKGTGVFGKNTNINVNSSMAIKNNKQNVGILSMEKGDVDFKGNVDIAGNSEIKKGSDSAMGIYKFGSGNVTIGTGEWNIGQNSFGVIANSEVEKEDKTLQEEGINITNNSNMTVKKGAVGIYSLGNNELTNNGTIKVEEGAERGNSSVGIYMENNKDNVSLGYNTGNITVSGKNSIGVQAVGNVEFYNKGTIDVLNSGIGVYATNGASIYNSKEGIINLGLEDGKHSEGTMGMYAKGENSFIINEGTINANNGIGMYVEDKATLQNSGNINLKNGIGIKGDGNLINTGTIKIESGFGGIDIDKETDSSLTDDIIKVNGNFAVVGPNYTTSGGMIDSDIDLSLKNPTVDISGGKLGFDAPSISGGITLAPNFATMGNGYEIAMPDFADKDIDLDVNTSPLFNGKVEDGDLIVNKVDYKDVMKDYQYTHFYNSLDKTLESGSLGDKDAIKNLNSYLDGFKDSPEFYKEYGRVMSEARGSIYSHVQSRMQDVDRAFNNAFTEMEESYNLSKDTEKYSLIYTDGDYKNQDLELPNYDYRIAGLMFMREFEEEKYSDKYGYSFGFTGSKFKFADVGGSEENIYSIKAGAHNVKTLDKDLDMITKLELGLNYHETDRRVSYGANSHSADSDFWSYTLSLDNKFRKTLYKDYQNQFGAYLGTEFEYGRFTDIKEDGTLALEVKANEYFSAKALAGFNGVGRKYLGNDWTGKIVGDIGYSYDFGKNYDGNSSKIRNSNDGYISLMNEMETEGKVSAKIGIGVERLNHLGVTLEGEVAKDFQRDEDYWSVGLRFNYKFNQEDVVTTLRNTFNFKNNHFGFDKDNLTKEEEKIVEFGSKIIDKYDLKGTIVLEGHTDSYGSVKYNQGLSERRAETVKKEFMKKVQKSENIKYKTKGYSELKPVDTNKTKQGRANNRRTEVKFYSNK